MSDFLSPAINERLKEKRMGRPKEQRWEVESWRMWDQTEYLINYRICVQITYVTYTPGFHKNLRETITEKFLSMDRAYEYLKKEINHE